MHNVFIAFSVDYLTLRNKFKVHTQLLEIEKSKHNLELNLSCVFEPLSMVSVNPALVSNIRSRLCLGVKIFCRPTMMTELLFPWRFFPVWLKISRCIELGLRSEETGEQSCDFRQKTRRPSRRVVMVNELWIVSSLL